MIDLFPVAARIVGAGALVTGVELIAAIPALAVWDRGGTVAVTPRLGTPRLSAVLLAVLGASFLAFPAWCLAGGGLLAATVLAGLVVRLQPIGDGADVMTVLVLVGLGLLHTSDSPGLTRWAAGVLAFNVTLAYWWSGAAKLRVPAWRTGRQIALALNTRRFGAPSVAWHALQHVRLVRLTGWCVIGLELACPVFVALGGSWLLAWVGCALVMHVAIAVLMGLGRFLCAFAAGACALVAARGLW